MLVETTHLRASIQFPCLTEWPTAKCDVRSHIIAASPLSYIMCFCYESASFIRQLSPLFTVRTQCGDCLSRDTLNIYEESYMILRSHVSRCICVSAVCSLFYFFFYFVVLRKIRCAIQVFRVPCSHPFFLTMCSDLRAVEMP